MSAALDAGAGGLGTRRAGSAWIWNRHVDLAVFGGSALVALAFVALGPSLWDDGALPLWGFFAFVVAIDVAHVWSTLYRTYLDVAELKRRPLLYAGVPLGSLAIGIALHSVSAVWFWRTLAYVAVFHFIRQQAGWVAIYRARANERERVDRVVDDAAVYASTLFPLAYWHAHAPRAFEWFVEGDFVALPSLRAMLPALAALWALALLAYAVRAWTWFRRGRLNVGKHLVVTTTTVTWLVGIVLTDSDFQFTVANVIVHGAPYFALLYFYLRERAREGAGGALGAVARGGVAAFFGVAVCFAFVEELLWDRVVWHARPSLFGGSWQSGPTLSPRVLAIVVPLLALPQATHYVLDAVLWRRKDTSPAQARALGFADPPRPS